MRLRNEDSGFCVLRVKARGQRDLNTIIGHAANIGAGEFMRASTHGVQFRADFLRSAPTTSWLSASRTCEHVYRICVLSIANLSAQVVRFLISESVSQNRTAYGLAPAVRPPRPVSRSYAGLRCSTLII